MESGRRSLAVCGVETHLVVTQSAMKNFMLETAYTFDDLASMAANLYDVDDVGRQ